MKFTVNTLDADKQPLDCLVIGIFADSELSLSARQIDAVANHAIENSLKNGDFSAKLGQTLLLNNLPGLNTKRVLLVGCGEIKKINEAGFIKAVKAAFKKLKQTTYESIGFYLTELLIPNRSISWLVRSAIIAITETDYCFQDYKSKQKDGLYADVITFFAPSAQDMAACEEAIREGNAIAMGMTSTKNLANTPCNVCTPTYIAEQAQTLGKEFSKLKIKVHDEKALEKMGFGAFCAVSQGSVEPGKLVLLEYNGGEKNATPIALVGKGITFDTGGLSLKPAPAMVEMKYDMSGAATVFGVIKAIAKLELPINVVAALACAENMPAGNAIKPESVIKTLSGQTVEITNTDAEGRLVLCDTLTYMEQEYKPKAMIDLATLTGAIVVALGRKFSGFFSNNAELTQSLQQASEQAHDPIWQLPLDDSYGELLESTVADMMNASLVRVAGSSVAAWYLSQFVNDTPWVHIDIAGTANTSGSNKAATGRAVPLLVQYLLNQANTQG